MVAESKGKMAHDFRVFMGHKGSMESKYTTNKGMLPEILLREMHESFVRAEEFLDLETDAARQDQTLETRQNLHDAISEVTPAELDLMLKALYAVSAGKTGLAIQGS